MTIYRLGCILRRRLHASLLAASLVGVGFLLAEPASATVFTYQLLDHPDGSQNPPPYGLRIDGLSNFVSDTGSETEVWSFSFDAGSMLIALDDVAMTLTLSGSAAGGKDVNQDPAGPSTVDIFFQYDFSDPASVTSSGFFNGHPFLVLQQDSLSDPVGTGSLTFLDGNSAGDGIPDGTVVNMVSFGMDDGDGEIVIFKADDHRLDCGGGDPDPGCGFPVLFGWVGLVDDLSDFDAKDVFHEESQDWLATTTTAATPEPASLTWMGVGLLALWWGRRRTGR